jgi:hypothetical protein
MSHDFSPFSIARLPRIEFGSGALDRLPDIAAGYGQHLLLVTGARSFAESSAGTRLLVTLRARQLCWEQVSVCGEPSPGSSMRPSPPGGQLPLTLWSASVAAARSMRPRRSPACCGRATR